MKCAFWVVAAVLLMTAPLFAGQNPDVRAFLTFDPTCPNPYVHEQVFGAPGAYNVYLCIECFGPVAGVDGARAISLKWTTSAFGMAFSPTFYLTGTQQIGGPDQDMWVLSWPDPAYPNECGIIKVLLQPYFVSAAGGTITLAGNTVDGKAVVDADNNVDQFCVRGNVGLGATAPAGDLDCTGDCPLSPVNAATWGAIKSLYR